jgi:hypothetical protein
VVQLVPDSGSAGCVGTGVPPTAIRVDVGLTVAVDVGVGADVEHVQSDSPVHDAFLQLPDVDPEGILQIRLLGHSELFIQLLLQRGTCVGVGVGCAVAVDVAVAVAVGVGDGDLVGLGDGDLVGLGDGLGVGDGDGVGLGLGVGVTQTQSVSDRH